MGRIKELSSGVPSASDSFVFDGLKGTKKISLEALERKLIEDGVGNGTLISQINQNVTDMVPSSALLYAMDQAQTEALESVNSALNSNIESVNSTLKYPWKVLKNQVEFDDTLIYVSVPDGVNQIVIHVGTKNGTQVYGGMSLLLVQGLPCHVPIFNYGTTNAFQLAYIYWDSGAKNIRLKRASGGLTLMANIMYT